MANILMLMVGFFYGIRGWKRSFEHRFNSCQSTMKNKGASFYWNGLPFDLEISDFWHGLYPIPFMLKSNIKGGFNWASHLSEIVTSFCLKNFSAFFHPPRSGYLWAFCPIR